MADEGSYSVPGALASPLPPYAQSNPVLARVESRLQFPPSYVVVGVYRLFTDKNLYVPAWQKCKHGVTRGLIVGSIWAFATFHIQRKFVELFLLNSPRVTGLTNETVFGYTVPFDLPTYATTIFLSTQISTLITFFLSRNIRVARERAWDQTVASRNKGADFWWPYVEEWEVPPQVNLKSWGLWEKVFGSWFGRFFVTKVLILPLKFIPFLGLVVSSWLRALGTARYLHKPYFEAKKMTPYQTAVFIEERKWDYRAFGFSASLLESLPIIGLIFSLSNRVGAAMWAHDLEKRQHYHAELQGKAPEGQGDKKFQ